MTGQGGPRTSREEGLSLCRGEPPRRSLAALAGTLALWLCAWAEPLCGADQDLRVRIAWGGGSERVWQGRVALSDGSLSEPKPLGMEADEAGLLVLQRGRPEVTAIRGSRGPQRGPILAADGYLAIRPWSKRSYDGVDLLVTAPPEASLFVELSGVDDKRRPDWAEVRLADLVQGSYSTELDDRGNRLVVRRTPGDDLRVKLARRSLVFGPGELLKCEVQPHSLPVASGTKVRIKVQLQAGRGGQELWAEEHAMVAGGPVAFPLEVPLGKEEGVYELVVTAHHAARLHWPQPVRAPLGLKQQPVAQRSVQLVVLTPQPLAAPPGTAGRLAVVEEIDPANPKWRMRLARLPQIPRLPRLGKGPLTSGHSQSVQHALGSVTQLAPNSQAGEVSWEAYTLSIDRPGEPHVLEVEYPSDAYQTLGISVIEPNAAGAVVPIGLDSGVDQAEEIAAVKLPAQWLRHRLVFWPRTKTPVVLITNRRDQTPAVYGKIRVLSGWQHLPRAFPAAGPRPERLLAAYMDRPLLPKNFSASETLGSLNDLSVDDWTTFYESGSRLVEYLHYVGYNALMLSVLADGSTIYPSTTVPATPRYDNGAYFATGQDPIRKDVLEMLLRMFDREGLQLIPALEFASPLPELEALLDRGGAEAEGVSWIGPEGTSWRQVHGTHKGRAPYYNVLHPRVQESMLAVVRELVAGYAQHPAFAGLALQLSPHGYAQLPGPQWGLDDATIAQFEQDLKLRVPGSGPRRFAERAEALTYLTPEGQREWRSEWLEWRATRLTRFYRRVQAELTAVRPGARLYLAGAEMLAGDDLARKLRPALPRQMTMAGALLWVGIDARQYGDNEGLVLLRPERIVPRSSLAAQAVDLEIAQMPDADRYFQNLSPPGSLLFHPPQGLRVPSFDEKGPFRPCYTWLAAQPVPSGWQNRRRFVHSLATLDAQAIFDGGWLLSMGQEDAIRDLVAVYRQLPAVRLERLGEQLGPSGGQPVTVRFGVRGDRAYVLLVNDAPFPTTTRLRVDAPAGARLQELTGLKTLEPLQRDAEGTYWDVELGPYDLVAAWFSSPKARVFGPQVALPSNVKTVLEKQVGELGYRVAALRNPPLLEVLENPGFDRPAASQGQIPGWIGVRPSGVTIQLDPSTKFAGTAAVRLASNGPAGGLVSQPFAPPATGRLAMLVRMRVADAAKQPPVRLVVEGRLHGRTAVYFAQFGQAAGEGTAVQPIDTQWSPYIVEVTDLPLETLSAVRVRLELTGPGEVWIDDVQLCDLAFSKGELTDLKRLITPVGAKLEKGEFGDCVRLLEGYWPRLLAEKVRLAEPPMTGRVERTTTAQQKTSKEPDRSPNLLDRVKSIVPERLRF